MTPSHHASRWYLRQETLKAANGALVNHHHRLPVASVWGEGTASSSDGQRFGIQAPSLLASFYPRYFGYYDRAVTVYTHVSDQFSAFASRVISCSPREAIYVLDGLLENDTVLRPREHYTDTHGFTEQFRVGDYEEIMIKVSPLALISNAVLVWNTVRFAEIVEALERTSGSVCRQDLGVSRRS